MANEAKRRDAKHAEKVEAIHDIQGAIQDARKFFPLGDQRLAEMARLALELEALVIVNQAVFQSATERGVTVTA